MNISNYYRNTLGIYQQQNSGNMNYGNAGIREGDFPNVTGQSGDEVKQHSETEKEPKGAETGEQTKERHFSKDAVLQTYQEICDRFSQVSFRLDDREEAVKYQAVNGVDCCPYMGYQNSMNQVGEYFGEKDQKSVELDVSVIEKSNRDAAYRNQLLETLKTETEHYDSWIEKADEHGISNLCISIFDDGKGIETAGNFSNYAFSTEDQIKTIWSRQTAIEQMMNQSSKMKKLLFGEDF